MLYIIIIKDVNQPVVGGNYIQFASERSKTSKETREVYKSTLQVSNTFYLVQLENSRLST